MSPEAISTEYFINPYLSTLIFYPYKNTVLEE
jgi:hypothetical protein